MKAPPFRYVRAESVDHALDLLAAHGDDAQILAGGQSLVPALNLRLAAPKLVIDINGLSALGGIAIAGDSVRIGALARHAEVLTSEAIQGQLPLIAKAMPHVAHVAVRNRGTFGGSIAYADPAAELPACAVALDARFVLQSKRGRREVAAADFFKGLYQTERAPDELLIEAFIPRQRLGFAFAFGEVVRRHGDFAIVGLAAIGRWDGARVQDLKLVYFGCEDRPKLATGAIKVVRERKFDAVAVEAAVAALDRDLDPVGNLLGSAAAKRHIAKTITRRALGSMFRN